MSLVYFRKCKGKDVTMALGCLPVFPEGFVSGFVGKQLQNGLCGSVWWELILILDFFLS